MNFVAPYFFVPATKLHKIELIRGLGSLEVIVDFEDSVAGVDVSSIFFSQPAYAKVSELWFRIPLINTGHVLFPSYQKELAAWGVRQWVIPKLRSPEDFDALLGYFDKEDKFIVLIEDPYLLLHATRLLEKHHKRIHAIGLGSHDLMSAVGAEHTHENLSYPRKVVKYLAAAYGIQAIDIASMNIQDSSGFFRELESGGGLGYDSKFLLHPIQFQWYQAYVEKQSKQMIEWAERIMQRVGTGSDGEISAFEFEGEIVEKPHVLKAIEILKKYRS